MNYETGVGEFDLFLRLMCFQKRPNVVYAIGQVAAEAVVVIISDLEDLMQSSQVCGALTTVLIGVFEKILERF